MDAKKIEISYSADEVIDLVVLLDTVRVSLARMGSYFNEIGPEKFAKAESDFINDWCIFQLVTHISSKLSDKIPNDSKLEEELFERVEAGEVWSFNSRLPSSDWINELLARCTWMTEEHIVDFINDRKWLPGVCLENVLAKRRTWLEK